MSGVITALSGFPWETVGGAAGLVTAAGWAVKGVRDWRSGRRKSDADADLAAAGADRAEIENADRITQITLERIVPALEKQVSRLEERVEKLTNDLSASSAEAARWQRAAADAQADLARYRREAEHSAEELRRAGAYIEELVVALRAAQVPLPPPLAPSPAPSVVVNVEGGQPS